ncbi:MAG: hypothetical protein ACOYOV_07435 [Bacteroidales bacterium]
MRNLILILSFFLIVSCKTSEKQVLNKPIISSVKGKYTGMVSHQFQKQGCKTIIIVNNDKDHSLRLIPMNELEAKFDKDQLKISFDYLPLRIKNPEGCGEGIPAEISNIAVEGK